MRCQKVATQELYEESDSKVHPSTADDECHSTAMVTKTNLDKLYGEISKTLEKISSREKYLNSQLESQLTEYR